MSTGTALVTITPEQYPVLAGSHVTETIKQNMAGESVSPDDLNRIKVPSGGGTLWTVIDANGEETGAKELEGIIVHITRRRAYWSSSKLSKSPPDCSSIDCVNGRGSPGGDCESCPFNQFGTAVDDKGNKGRGKACKERKLLFILRQGEVLPDVVSAPPGSLKLLRQYQLKLGVPYWSVVTRLTLEKKDSAGGEPFAQIKAVKVGQLAPEVSEQIMKYAQELSSVFSAVTVDSDEPAPDADTRTF